jgi:hypothetical protein
MALWGSFAPIKTYSYLTKVKCPSKTALPAWVPIQHPFFRDGKLEPIRKSDSQRSLGDARQGVAAYACGEGDPDPSIA